VGAHKQVREEKVQPLRFQQDWPFASSLCLGDNLFVFPLNIPVFREDFKPLTRTYGYYGELLVTNAERVNIETGDAAILDSKNPQRFTKRF